MYIEDFMYTQVGVSVVVEDYFRVGVQEPRLTVVFLQTGQQKRDVLRFKSNLKGLKNWNQKPMYINDYIPAAIQEKRKRDADIFSINENLQQPVDVKFVKGRLTVAGSPYVQKITPPSPKDLVDISPERIEKILQTPIQEGGIITQERSIFTGYTAAVDSYSEVRDLYIKLKLMHPGVRHIVCAFWIRGDPFYSQDFCDDGEISAGRSLLNILLNNNMENRVVFVARKFGGTKMGSSRFECYREAAISAIQSQPWNNKLKLEQKLSVNRPPNDANSEQSTTENTLQSANSQQRESVHGQTSSIQSSQKRWYQRKRCNEYKASLQGLLLQAQ